MQAVFHDASLIAPSESRVLITGESGVGKEVLADVIHGWSARAGGPLVKVNCAAIPETLLETELFGHEKGAFTSAVAQRIGRFEEANGGTIFLDEIGDMSPPLQSKLLRVTQNGCFNRVGSNREWQTNARILAATNKNLEEQVKAGSFREDLFYRLNVVELNLPALRERPEDVLPLANHFLAEFTQGKARFSAAVAAGLARYAWPGNVRELRNAMERAALLVARRIDFAGTSAGAGARGGGITGAGGSAGCAAAGGNRAAGDLAGIAGASAEPDGNGQGPGHQPPGVDLQIAAVSGAGF